MTTEELRRQIDRLPLGLNVLDLREKQIKELPENIGRLVNLRELYLSDNELEELPESIGNLQNLTELILYNNQLKELPNSIGKLQNLTVLSLENNQLKRLPKSILQLKKLKQITLVGNKFSLPSSYEEDFEKERTPSEVQEIFEYIIAHQPLPPISEMTTEELGEYIDSLDLGLEVLDLGGERIKELPENIGRLVNLRALGLVDNELQKLPESIGDLQNLTMLNLENNQLQKLPKSIVKLQNLAGLNFSNNQLQKLPESIVKLQNLTWLYLGGNQMEELLDSIGKLQNLTVLSLENNQLKRLPKSILQLKKLKQITLVGNKFSLPSSYEEDFEKERTTSEVQEIFEYIIAHQPLLPKMTTEELGEYIDSLDLETEELDLGGKGIEELPENIGRLVNLRKLSLGNNQLQELPDSIGNLQNLIFLILHNNQLQELPNSIVKLQNLTILNLRDNELQELPNSIVKLQNLTIFNLGNNPLKYLPKSIGKLQSLTVLSLRNNQLKRLPKSILQLKKIKQITLADNKFPLPPNYKEDWGTERTPSEVQEIFEYIIHNQAPADKALKIEDIYIFRNISSAAAIQDEYKSKVDAELAKYELKIHEIQKVKDIDNKTTIVFIIAPFDSHANQDLIFNIIGECEKREIKYRVLIPEKESVHGGLMNFEQVALVAKKHKKIRHRFPEKVLDFTSVETLANAVLAELKQFSPTILLQKVVLDNMGHFEAETIHFDEQITCLVGANGTGKSTILRAIALGLLGNHKEIDKKRLEKMLRISSWEAGKMNFATEGAVSLTYSIDGEEKTQKIVFNHSRDKTDISNKSEIETLQNERDLKTLIIGFPQIRTNGEGEEETERSHPNVSDVLPLINNIEKSYLASFSSWISNLYAKANVRVSESEEKINLEDTTEFILIQKIFGIISELTNQGISFQTVGSFSPPQIIVSTFDSPRGIPLDLLSQGFKVMIAWVGHLLERMAMAKPNNKHHFEKEKAIVIIDEIDSYIHPLWQQNFIKILRTTFPKTQFIISTHSPLLIAGLDRQQIVELEYNEEKKCVEAKEMQVDTWALSYAEILDVLFNTKAPIPKETIQDLKHQLKTAPEDKKAVILEIIEKLKENADYIKSVESYKLSLQEQEEKLQGLVSKLEKKLKSLE